MKKRLILNIPYLVFNLVCTDLGEAWRVMEGINASGELLSFFPTLGIAFASPLPSFHMPDLVTDLICGVCFGLVARLKGKNAKEYRRNAEYGSARRGGPNDIAPSTDPVSENSVFLIRIERLMMSNRPKNSTNARDKNVLIVGGSGFGKTRFWIRPDLLQLHSPYVLVDPEGATPFEVGNAFAKAKYRIRFFDTVNFKKSIHYSPFTYTHSKKNILKLITTLTTDTKGDDRVGDELWMSAIRSPAVESQRTHDYGHADNWQSGKWNDGVTPWNTCLRQVCINYKGFCMEPRDNGREWSYRQPMPAKASQRWDVLSMNQGPIGRP